MEKTWWTILISLALSLTACASYRPLPTDLPFPQKPTLMWMLKDESVCLTEDGANKYRRWVDELSAFDHAWKRLRTPTTGAK